MLATEKLTILHVDDESDVRSTLRHDLRDNLRERGIEAEVIPCASIEDAIERLQEGSVHLIVLDLRFGTVSGDGNNVIATVLETKIIPIIIYSGFPHELNHRYENHGLIHVAEKKKTEILAAKIEAWHLQKVFEFFSEDGWVSTVFRTALQRLMWDHVSRHWDHLFSRDNTLLSRTAGRIGTTILHDALVTSPEYLEESGEAPVHHGEVYIFDCPREYLSVGDILQLESSMYAVLTPSCDLIPRSGSSKSKIVLLAECQTFSDFSEENSDFQAAVKGLEGGKKVALKSKERLTKLMRHAWLNEDGRRFFLPPFADFDGGVIDFLKTRVEDYQGEARAELVNKRLVSLNREVTSELAARFSRFMIRLGQAPYAVEPLLAAMKSMGSA